MSNHLRKSGVTDTAPRSRSKKWIATGIAGLTGVVALGMVAGSNAGAMTRLDDIGGQQSQKDGSGWEGREGAERGPHATSVPCDATALVAAINTANQFLGGTLKLARGCTYELRNGTANNGLPPITTDITIQGEHSTIERAFDLASAAPTLFRIFQVNAGGNLRLADVTLRNGLVTSVPGGGAMLVQAGGRAEVKNVKFAQNNARGPGGINGGALTNLGTTVIKDSKFTLNNGGQNGGAVYNTGTLTVEKSHFETNRVSGAANNGGGGIASAGGSVVVRESTFVGNQSAGDGGGLLLTSGTGEISDSTFRLNVAINNGGGVANDGGTLSLRNVKFLENTAAAGAGGGLYTAAGTTTTILPAEGEWPGKLSEWGHSESGKDKGGKEEESKKDEKAKKEDGGKGSTATDKTEKSEGHGGGDGGKPVDDEKWAAGEKSAEGDKLADFAGPDADEKLAQHRGTIFYGNVAGNAVTGGGAIYNAGTITIADSLLLRNQAGGNGGGLNNAVTGVAVIQRSVITENQASNTGGGIFNLNATAGSVTIDTRTLVFRNNPNNCAGPGTPIANCQG
ncbi:hypothetical protein [Micromonospora yangpuensis]|uniref:Polymorphic outer membrane protein repeat-containing protein n=1 Tax=Micromonospora yangpuensis TaxID=683228 RepID=A0A1C6UY22_9ACTN|nr:hypothetical protein [Micromonospora yangpuensis]GGL95032.1 hypothetical protein GCM10012279_10570 [Micromonospora yangpuensis]SCL58936.1 hypothetical protein GA0070617_3956 [Micromonospora yangpuensis]